MAAVTVEALSVRLTEIRTRIEEIDAESAGEEFTDEQRTEWNALNAERESIRKHVAELEARKAVIASLDDESLEAERIAPKAGRKSRVPDDPHDMAAYRNNSGSLDELHAAYQEGALRIVERIVPAAEGADKEASQERLERVLKTTDAKEGTLARRIIAAGSPLYERAFAKYLAGEARSSDEERALSLTTTAGGFAVPVTLDPTVILTSAGVVNPVRQLARIVTITGNTWNGVNSTGVTAAYAAALTEAGDNAPTLAQPQVIVDKAQCFIPFDIEIGQDWGSLSSEMSMMFADAKDTLESAKFLTGLGHASSEPQGLIAVGGATAAVSSATTAVFAIADLYSLENALQPRPRAKASIVANKAAFQKVRQFDTAGGASLWTQLQFGEPASLIGYPAYEWSNYSSAVTTSGSTIMTIGDFSRFLIVDRVGMDVELIPHMFATGNNRPSGQRGLYAYWRNGSAVLAGGLVANSAFVSLKLL
jgi:HK97 family phage major capsid protein